MKLKKNKHDKKTNILKVLKIFGNIITWIIINILSK